jgi:hypothetical protein
MRIHEGRRRYVALIIAVALTSSLSLPLTGCAAVEPAAEPPTSLRSPTPSVPPTPAPIFASGEEALAEARTAYTGYIETADLILTEGGANPERIDEFTSGPLAEYEHSSYEYIRENGIHGIGTSTYSNMTLEWFEPAAVAGNEVVIVSVYSDIRGTDMVDASGQSTQTGEILPLTPFLVSFVLAEPGQKRLKAEYTTSAEEEGVCLP